MADDKSPDEQGTDQGWFLGDSTWARRGCLALFGLFLTGAAIIVAGLAFAANSFVSSSGYNAVGTYLCLLIAAALAIGGIVGIVRAVLGWGPRDRDAG